MWTTHVFGCLYSFDVDYESIANTGESTHPSEKRVYGRRIDFPFVFPFAMTFYCRKLSWVDIEIKFYVQNASMHFVSVR